MRIFRPKRRLPEVPVPTPPDSLKDRGILVQWFILYRLAEEIARARRYGRPLTVMVARPGAPAGDAILTDAAAAVAGTARATDLVGWLSRRAILIVMPETARRDALTGVRRWLREIWSVTRAEGGVPWKVRTLAYPDDFADIGEFQIAVTAFVELELSEAA